MKNEYVTKTYNNIKVSLILNIITALFTFVASIIMFTGFNFMHTNETVLESSKLGMLKFFTVQSNIFMGIIALLFAFEEIKLLNEKSILNPCKQGVSGILYAGVIAFANARFFTRMLEKYILLHCR